MSLFSISEASYLAFHSLAIISSRKTERLNVKTLASMLGASSAHLAKIFQKLAKSGYVKSTRGPSGGFELARKAENITFYEIYEVLEGKVKTVKCPLEKDKCIFEKCILGSRFRELSADLVQLLREIKLSDFRG